MMVFFVRRSVVLSVVGSLLMGLLISQAALVQSASAALHAGLVHLNGNVPAEVAHARLLGHHQEQQISFELALATNHEDQLDALLRALYTPHSSLYHHWLPKGAFDARFGPTPSQVSAVKDFLTRAGLTPLAQRNSAFLLPVRGPLSKIEAAFHISLHDYQTSGGRIFFSNGSNPQVPANLRGMITGILGLDNLPPAFSHLKRPGKKSPSYGGGPKGTGLTPSQIQSLYNATPVLNGGNTAQNQTLAVFELSAYTPSDIQVYENQFGLQVPLQDMPVNGGTDDHSAAGEVEMDIELQIALAPGAQKILVYQAEGTDEIDEYAQIAKDDEADTISTSWGDCENDLPLVFLEEENIQFQKMAGQGQSIFAASGDEGAYECGESGGLQVDNPASQPFMTGVGGTSFYDGGYDPGKKPNPPYPGASYEPAVSYGGGGISRVWGMQGYQLGRPGVIETGYSQSGTYCHQQAKVFCREVPDVSINADYYSIYCTDPGDPEECNPKPNNGWQNGSGTSASAPLWSAIAALVDNAAQGNMGLFTNYVYGFDTSRGYSDQFHDITTGSNGYYPAGLDYDIVTGIGTPNIEGLVEAAPLSQA